MGPLMQAMLKWKHEKEEIQELMQQVLAEKEEKSRVRCVVEIEHPRLLIKGKKYQMPKEVLSTKSFQYFAFLGIPYAALPKRNPPFQPPQPFKVAKSASEPKMIKAYSSDHPCLQSLSYVDGKFLRRKLIGSLDCLYLNIYIRERPEKIPNLLPVLVHIHGGGFKTGSNALEQIKPYHILRSELIFVTINYRLGLLGFLNMGTEECQGNAGLKDQVKALEWIKLNIEKFGGDPNNITISGHEAGATCVNLHLISPLSKNLFHKAIVQAGGIYSPWGFQKKPKYFEQIFSKEKNTDPNTTRETVVRVMKGRKVNDLLRDIDRLARRYSERKCSKLAVHFGPSMEFREKGAFIPPRESGIESLMKEANGNIPVIAGITKQEGYEYFHRRPRWSQQDFMYMLKEENSFIKFLRENLNWSLDTASKRSDKIKQTYFQGSEMLAKSDFQTLQDNFATFVTDIWFHRFFDNFKIGVGSCTPLYVYQLVYYDRDNAEEAKELPPNPGYEDEIFLKICRKDPGHGDDMKYLYNPINLEETDSPSCRITRLYITHTICTLWSNFCYKADPIPGYVKWTPHTEEKPCYLSIDKAWTMVWARLGGEKWTDLRNMGILESESSVSLSEP